MTLKSKLTINRQAEKALRELECLVGEIQWGLPDLSEVDDYPDGTDIRDVAFWNEFGTGRIPARGYFKRSALSRKRDLRRDSRDVAYAIARGRLTCDKGLDLIGQQAAATLKKDLTDFKDPGNADLTIALKGFDNPMIETGHMRSEITHRVVKS